MSFHVCCYSIPNMYIKKIQHIQIIVVVHYISMFHSNVSTFGKERTKRQSREFSKVIWIVIITFDGKWIICEKHERGKFTQNKESNLLKKKQQWELLFWLIGMDTFWSNKWIMKYCLFSCFYTYTDLCLF